MTDEVELNDWFDVNDKASIAKNSLIEELWLVRGGNTSHEPWK